MVRSRQGKNPLKELEPLLDRQVLVQMQEEVAATHVSDEIVAYAVRLIAATRQDEKLRQGASPRATLCLIAMAKAVAQLRGRDYVVPKDVREVFMKTVPHRLLLTTHAENSGMTAQEILKAVLEQTPAPALR